MAIGSCSRPQMSDILSTVHYLDIFQQQTCGLRPRYIFRQLAYRIEHVWHDRVAL